MQAEQGATGEKLQRAFLLEARLNEAPLLSVRVVVPRAMLLNESEPCDWTMKPPPATTVPQSKESVPRGQSAYTEAGLPSSQIPSYACSVHLLS